MVDPYTVPIVAPAIPFPTRRATTLAQKSRGALNIALAVVSAAILRGAGELHSFRRTTITIPVVVMVVAIVASITIAVPITLSIVIAIPITVAIIVGIVTVEVVAITIAGAIHLARVHDEIRAATMIDPHASLIESPACSLHAG